MFLKTTEAEIQPLPFAVYFWVVALLALAGILNAVYLSISHYRVYTDIAYKSFCAISRAINCDTVSQSDYSVFGGIPLAVWGLIGYLFFSLLLLFARTKAASPVRIWALLVVLSLIFSLICIILAVISTFFIGSLCIMCILGYAISFLLLYYTWLVRKRFKGEPIFKGIKKDIQFLWRQKASSAAVFAPFIVLVILTLTYFPVYWSFESPKLTANTPFGVTDDGHPWVGAEDPEIVITEFADYLCFQCNKMHFYLRQLLVNHPGKIRIVHRHFPMDHTVNPLVKNPIHIGSGTLAKFAIYAGTQDKFWQMSDLLFAIARQRPQIDAKFLADSTGLNADALSRAVNHPAIHARLKKDIMEGLKMGVRGTPSFVINGKLYRGQIPAEVLTKILD
jgi:protein-disulfide isomerase/uncharacterized membrane protein